MTYLDYLKKSDNIDKYILLLLFLDFGVEDTANAIKVTRQTVYNVIERNKKIVKEYMESVKDVVDKTKKPDEA